MKTHQILGLLALMASSQISFAQGYLYFGNTNDLGTSSVHSANFLLGSKIAVDSTVDLTAAGVIFSGTGYNANIGIYSANATTGLPDQLLATTGSFAVTATGTVQIPFIASQTVLPGNYWFLADYSGTASVRYANGTGAQVAYRSLPFTSTLPTSFGTASSYTGQSFNYFLVSQPAAVPEPGTWALASFGGTFLIFGWHRRKNAKTA